ncbi:uncharacterized protein PGTG_22348 [Puccinia graminis f. sp. tritici CRL 75-36-700-3]|uniref:Uncharacterized protein n=1 Tax=Puccinia graminis f. sp. tritici (strain CRL 75-36-700-3 / race SCCL) TaxID=418459 RepID=H6QU52_PUCGT|nr:uncharacterized protein PGTG_22348 [Puccinia graminis f. sp. tritici CRL 75-36-700-3]EHS64466.1 hypothetical protein PGTG_22348 [Puccinia graminis f. sp. tritici CRL 75-36-700-3]
MKVLIHHYKGIKHTSPKLKQFYGCGIRHVQPLKQNETQARADEIAKGYS